MKEDLTKYYESANMETASQCRYQAIYVMSPQIWHIQELLKELRTFTIQELQASRFNMLQECLFRIISRWC